MVGSAVSSLKGGSQKVMRLAFAFLAEAAKFTADGKLWVLGGDVQYIAGENLPVFHPAVTLVVKAGVAPEECGREHIFYFDAKDPDGNDFLNEVPASVTPRLSEEYPELPVGIALAMNMQQLRFTHFGEYRFRVRVDDQELASVPFYVLREATSKTSDDRE